MGGHHITKAIAFVALVTIIAVNALSPALPTLITALAGHGVVPSPKIDESVLNEVRSNGVATFMVILREPDWGTLNKVSAFGGHDAVVAYLKKFADSEQSSVVSAVQATGGIVLRRFWIMNAVLVRGGAATLNALTSLSNVVKIIPNFKVHVIEPVNKEKIGASQSVESWGIDKIRAPEAWAEGYTGEGIRIAIIDTGVDITHPALQGKMFTINASDEHYPGGWMEFDDNGNPVCSTPHDTDGHGTHTSGTALGGDTSDILIGVAPGAKLMHALVLPGGSGTFAQVLAGMEWAVDPYTCSGEHTGYPAHVMSMSLGASGYYGDDLFPAIKAALEANIVVVAAIGNDGPGTSSNPGNVWGVFGVGATDVNDQVADFSSGEIVNWPNPPSDWPFFDTYPSTYIKPDFSAPGVDITSSVPGGGYEAWSGTSMATPHVAGTVALILQAAGWTDFSHPDTPEDVYLILNQTAVDLGDPGQDTRYGYGRIDAYEAVMKAKQYAKKTGVEGHVYDAVDNSPVSWATVTVLETNQTVSVSSDGYFRIPLDPGNYTLLIQAWGYQDQTVSVEVVSGNGTIAGVVTDYVSGDPIAGAVINVSNGTHSWVTYTNSTGGYSVEVPPGTYDISASAPGYVNESVTGVNVGEGEVVLVNFALVKTSDLATIYGWVTDASTGDPIANANITVVEAGVSTTTNASGYYEISSLVPGNYTVTASATGYAESSQSVSLSPGEVKELNFSLTMTAAPIAVVGNVHYKTSPHIATIASEATGLPVIEYNNITAVLNDLRNGQVFSLIITDHVLYGSSYTNSTELIEFLNASKDSGIPVIFLGTPYSSTNAMQALYELGNDVEAAGYPAPDIRVYHWPDSDYVKVYVPTNMTGLPIFSGVTWDGTDGSFSWFYLADLGSSSYADYEVYNFTDDIGVVPLAVVNDSYNDVFGIGIAVWSPAPGLYWYYMGSWGESYWMQYLESGADGQYSNNTLTVLKNAISLAVSGASPLSLRQKPRAEVLGGEGRVGAKGYTYVDVYMERQPYGYLEGVVTDDNGDPLPGAKIYIEGAPFTLETGSDGSFSHWLPVGTYQVTISKEGYTTYATTVTITEGGTVHIDAQLKKLTWVAVMYDYAGTLKNLIESRIGGVYVKDFSDWQSLHDAVLAGGYDVVIFAGYYGAAFPSDPAQFTDIIDYLNSTGKGAIFMDSWGDYAYGIKLLNAYYGDPASVDDSYSDGYVYYVITQSHPIFRGYSVGETVYLINYSSADYSWFSGFSGSTIANLGAQDVGVKGGGAGVKEFASGSKWVLLSGLAPTSWNDPSYFTEDAWNIIINSVMWLLTTPLEVSVSPSTAHVGDEVTVSISGGEAGLEVAVYFSGAHVGNVTLNSDGEGSLTFTVPEVPGGTYLVEVRGGIYYGSAELTVETSVSVVPATVPQASSVAIEVLGAAPHTKYYVFIDGNIMSFFVTDENGSATVILNIPYYIGKGTHSVRVVTEGGEELAAKDISVVYGELYNYLGNKFRNIEDLIRSLQANMSTVAGMLENLSAQVATSKEEILDAINESRNSISALIVTKTGQVITLIEGANTTIVARLDDVLSVAQENRDLLHQIRDMLESINGTINERLASMEAELKNVLSGYVGYLAGLINDSKTGIIAAIASSEGYIVANITGAKNDLAGLITDKSGEIYALIETKYGIIAANLTEARNLLVGRLDELSDLINAVNESTSGVIRTESGKIYQLINTKSGEVVARLDSVKSDLSKGIEDVKAVSGEGSRNSLIAASAAAISAIAGIALILMARRGAV